MRGAGPARSGRRGIERPTGGRMVSSDGRRMVWGAAGSVKQRGRGADEAVAAMTTLEPPCRGCRRSHPEHPDVPISERALGKRLHAGTRAPFGTSRGAIRRPMACFGARAGSLLRQLEQRDVPAASETPVVEAEDHEAMEHHVLRAANEWPRCRPESGLPCDMEHVKCQAAKERPNLPDRCSLSPSS